MGACVQRIPIAIGIAQPTPPSVLYATLKQHSVHLQATGHLVQSLSWATAHCSTFARHTKPTAQIQPCKRAAIANTRQTVFSATDYRKLLINLQSPHGGQTI